MMTSDLRHLRNTHLCADVKIINDMAKTQSSAYVLDQCTHRGFTLSPLGPCFMMSWWRDTIEEISRCVTTVPTLPTTVLSACCYWTTAQIMLLFLWIKKTGMSINYLMYKAIFNFKNWIRWLRKAVNATINRFCKEVPELLGNCTDAGSTWLGKTWRTRGEPLCLLPFIIFYDIIQY